MFDDMIGDMKSNEKWNPIVIELFIRGRRLSVSLVFISQFFSKVPNAKRLNAAYYLSLNSIESIRLHWFQRFHEAL